MAAYDGGPAFPVLDDTGGGLRLREWGMSLRDYFAAKALVAIIAKAPYQRCDTAEARELAQQYAEAAYIIADAMIVARTAEIV